MIPIGEEDLLMMHLPTVRMKNGHRHMAYSSLVAYTSQGYLKDPQALLQHCTIDLR